MIINEKNLNGVISSLEKPRDEAGNKGTFGKLCVLSGSANFRGCASLCASAALRSGCGIVRLCSVERVCAAVSAARPEVTFYVTDEKDGVMKYNPEAVDSALDGCDAIVIGPGMGVNEETLGFTRHVLCRTTPTVLDADALNVISKYDKGTVIKGTNTVITPHIGEMARLTGLDINYVRENREKVAVDFAKKQGIVVVLKDAVTTVTDGEKVYNVDIKNSGLSKGGTGDVLCGRIGSYLSQGYAPLEASLLSVLKNAEKGLELKDIVGAEYMLPGDLV